MGILRTSLCALRSLSHKEQQHGSPKGRRLFAQLSQNMMKVDQPTVSRSVSKESLVNWLLPATLALLGLSFSTFCTHQLVATSDSPSLTLSAVQNKETFTAPRDSETGSTNSLKEVSKTL